MPWWERLGVPYAVAVPPREIERRHVLVVSHNPFLRRVVSDFVAQTGAIVETRASDVQALERPLAQLDLLISDYRFPGSDGLQFLKHVRTGRTGFPADVPFVLMAEAAERWLVKAVLGLDADGCLLLPLNAQKVEDAMALALKRPRVIAQLDDYEVVETERPPEGANTELAAPAPARVAHESFARIMPGARLLPVEEIRPGMVLGADLVSDRGLVLLHAGMQLNPAVVERLRGAAQSFGFGAVPIAPEGESAEGAA
jgi:CheY-like chemotaxis protein